MAMIISDADGDGDGADGRSAAIAAVSLTHIWRCRGGVRPVLDSWGRMANRLTAAIVKEGNIFRLLVLLPALSEAQNYYYYCLECL